MPRKPTQKPVDMDPTFRHLNDEMARAVLRYQQHGCGSHISDPTRWYCCQTHQGAEFLALFEIGKQGFTAFLPMFVDRKRKPVQRNGVVVIQPPPILPLFPGYLFVAFDPAADQWRRIASTRGVKRLFGAHPERPLPVMRGAVEKFIRQSGPQGYEDKDKPRRGRQATIGADTAIEVENGPLAGLRGICLKDDGDRVRVLMEIMGRQVPMQMDRVAIREVA